LQNIKDKLADKPAKKTAKHYRIHVLPLLNRRGWKQLSKTHLSTKLNLVSDQLIHTKTTFIVTLL
jgi:hypothetical protein